MHKTSAELKRLAKQQLKGRWAGLIMYTIRFANYEDLELTEVFNGFTRWIDSIVLMLVVGIFTFLSELELRKLLPLREEMN